MLWFLRIGWLLWVSLAEDAAEFPEEDGVLVLSECFGRHLRHLLAKEELRSSDQELPLHLGAILRALVWPLQTAPRQRLALEATSGLLPNMRPLPSNSSRRISPSA